MALITQRAFVYVPKKAVRLSGEEWTRSLGIGNGWSRIRFGFLCAITPDGVANLPTAGFAAGLCGGSTPGSGSFAMQNSIGMSIGGTLTGVKLFTYAAGGGYPIFTASTNSVFRKVQGVVYTETSGNTTTAAYNTIQGTFPRRTPIIIDVSRQYPAGIGSCTVTMYGLSSATAAHYQNDYFPNHLMDAVDQMSTPIINGNTLSTIWSAAVTASDNVYPLDSIFIYWSRTRFPLEIYAVCASVINDMSFSAGTQSSTDFFDNYSNGTATSEVISTGLAWDSYGTCLGNSNLAAKTGYDYAGTTYGVFDDFESYTVGTIQGAGGTISAGLNWDGSSLLL